jgi:hypothetical protein
MKRSYEKEVVERLKSLQDSHVIKAGLVRHEKSHHDIYSIHTTSSNAYAKNIFLSAGLHGDEPAGVYALLGFFENKAKEYDDKLNFFAIPCINPFGFEYDIRQNHNQVDLNRNFDSPKPEKEVSLVKKVLEEYSRAFLFTLDMHEDPTDKINPGFELKDNPRDFYMYEKSPSREASVGHTIIRELERKGIWATKQKKIYHDFNDGGLVWHQSPEHKWNEDSSELFSYLQRYTDYSFTTETPTCWAVDKRVDAHLTALDLLMKEFEEKN